MFGKKKQDRLPALLASLNPDAPLAERHLWIIEVADWIRGEQASVDAAVARVGLLLDAMDANPELRHLALMAQPINSIDITGVEAFARLEKVVAKRGGMIHVVGMKLPVEQRLKRAGQLNDNPRLLLYRTDAEFLAAMAEHRQRLQATAQAQAV